MVLDEYVTRRIDWLRGVFALNVALGHLFDISKISTSYVGILDFIRPVFGFQWVVGFFVISGFCIENAASGMSTDAGGVRQFLLRRSSRLLPTYYLVFLMCIFFEYLMYGSPERPAYWTNIYPANAVAQTLLTQGARFFKVGAFASFAATFTITHEVTYYLIWTLRIRFPKYSPTFWCVCLSLVLFLISFRIDHYGDRFYLILRYSPLWFVGALVYARYSVLKNIPLLAFLSRYSYILLAVVLAPYLVEELDLGRGWFFVLAWVFALNLLKSPAGNSALISARVTHFMGDISYPMFLIHGPVAMITAFALNSFGVSNFYLHFAMVIVITVTSAAVFTIFVERPILHWRKRKISAGHDEPATLPTSAIYVK